MHLDWIQCPTFKLLFLSATVDQFARITTPPIHPSSRCAHMHSSFVFCMHFSSHILFLIRDTFGFMWEMQWNLISIWPTISYKCADRYPTLISLHWMYWGPIQKWILATINDSETIELYSLHVHAIPWRINLLFHYNRILQCTGFACGLVLLCKPA